MEVVGFFWYGLAASVVFLVGVLACIQGFSGMKQEPFSFLNHFISELGDPRFAKHKTLFAVTMIATGILMVPFILGLGLTFNSTLGNVVMGLGLFCVISCVLVGFFPEHKVKTHFAVSGCFFVGMILLIISFTITIALEPTPAFPTWVILASIVALGVISSFIIDTVILPKWELNMTNEPWAWENGRPRFWLNPFLEWWAFFALVGWLLMVVILSF
ncbi:MAG TPA: DUF998 domain-containing protein [Candidatus Lokiarchaeia archaeon]|nr:DUF998 domain-containing protein [Candidatus Lokiarchaeia archaeon]